MPGTSLVVQWLRLHAPDAGDTGSSPSQGTKIQHVPWHSIKNISSNAFLEICYHRNAAIIKMYQRLLFPLLFCGKYLQNKKQSNFFFVHFVEITSEYTSPDGIFRWKYFHYKFSLFNRYNTIQVMYFFLSDFRQFASLKNCSISSKLSPLLAQSCSQKMLCCAQSLSRVQLFVNPWTVARQTPLSIGILQVRILECVACPPPGDLPNPGIEPGSPAFQANSLPAKPPWRPKSQMTRDLSILLISLKNTFLFH